MRKVKEVLRLKFDAALSGRNIAAICNCNMGCPTAARYPRRDLEAGIPSILRQTAAEMREVPGSPMRRLAFRHIDGAPR